MVTNCHVVQSTATSSDGSGTPASDYFLIGVTHTSSTKFRAMRGRE